MNRADSLLAGFFHRRECIVPTWRGWLVLIAIIATAATIALRGAYSFLAVTDRVPGNGGALVVEGWGPDFFMADAIKEYRENHYGEVFVTGGPIEKGAMFAKYGTYAEFAAASLEAMGLATEHLHTIPAQEVRRDRTYASAISLKKWLRDHNEKISTVTLMSLGPHSRRSRLLFEKAFGSDVKIGVIAVDDGEIDPQRWWTTSQGFRGVTGEMIAYIYARFLFHPPKDE